MTPAIVWIISISVIIFALAFVALVLFSIMLLLTLRRTIADVDGKIQAFEPFFRILSKTGNLVEERAQRSLKQAEEMEKSMYQETTECKDRALHTTLEVAQWALMGITLWQKFRGRDKS